MVTNVNNIAHKVEQEVPVTVFFDEGTTEEQMQEVGNLIQARPEVERIEFESADEAWQKFKDQYFQGSDAANGFKDDNPLVNSSNYQVYLNQIEKQTELVAYIQGLDHVRDVEQSEKAANTLGNFNKLASYASMIIIAILLVISIFLISNTVSVGIAVRKEEIGIMKYIGATDGFVRAPFPAGRYGTWSDRRGNSAYRLIFHLQHNSRIHSDTFQCPHRSGRLYSGMENLPDTASYGTGTWNRNRPDRKFPDFKKAFKSININI